MSPPASNIDTKFYRKSSQGKHTAVDLDPESARVFAVIDENIHLSKVAELANVSTAVLWKAIAKLSHLGLIEHANGDAGFMGQQFIDVLQKEFASAVGPIGNILLNKIATQLDIALQNIPVDRARELVSKLTDQIPDKNASAQFKQNLSRYL